MLSIPPRPERFQGLHYNSLGFDNGNILALEILFQCLKCTGICVAVSVRLKALNTEKFM